MHAVEWVSFVCQPPTSPWHHIFNTLGVPTRPPQRKAGLHAPKCSDKMFHPRQDRLLDIFLRDGQKNTDFLYRSHRRAAQASTSYKHYIHTSGGKIHFNRHYITIRRDLFLHFWPKKTSDFVGTLCLTLFLEVRSCSSAEDCTVRSSTGPCEMDNNPIEIAYDLAKGTTPRN